MISKEVVYQLVEEYLSDSGYFVTDVQITPDNRIVVEIDNEKGVDIDTCAGLSRYIESKLDRDAEDYELEVGSAGLTAPFRVLKQYVKNIGNEVEVLTRSGQKMSGVLKAAGEEGFTIGVTKKVKLENAKRKTEVEEDITFGYDEVKYTKYLIRFK